MWTKPYLYLYPGSAAGQAIIDAVLIQVRLTADAKQLVVGVVPPHLTSGAAVQGEQAPEARVYTIEVDITDDSRYAHAVHTCVKWTKCELYNCM